jgi:GTP-binding protein
MLVKSAKFIASYGQQTEMPDDKNLEIAFIGRSNVGKSSLINMLCGRKDLAKISGKPDPIY